MRSLSFHSCSSVSATSRLLGSTSMKRVDVTPDQATLIDRVASVDGKYFATASGHGFGMAPVMGRALADLTLTGQSDLPITQLGMSRFWGKECEEKQHVALVCRSCSTRSKTGFRACSDYPDVTIRISDGNWRVS
jgi:hypothetical protein